MTDARLYLLTPLLRPDDLGAFAPRFADALEGGDVACVLLRIAPGAAGDARRLVEALMEIAAPREAALLIEGDYRMAARLGADGAHVPAAEVADARESFRAQRIVGAGAIGLRDDAMEAGEAGADYVMFGDTGAPFARVLELTDWWAEIFQTPCVACAEQLDDVAPLAAAGADFVALGAFVWEAERPGEAVAAAMKQLGPRA